MPILTEEAEERVKQVRLWPAAHRQLDELCRRLEVEKGLPITYTDAASLAIVEATERRRKEQEAAEKKGT